MANTHTVTKRIVSAHGKEFLPGAEVDAAAEFGCYLEDVKDCLGPLAEQAPPLVEKKSKG